MFPEYFSSYLLLKQIHIACVIVSASGFFVRGLWMIARPQLLTLRWVKVAPHVVDTVLLVSALGMVFQARFSPLQHPWLAAKIAGLLLYIVLGSIALKRGRTRAVRITAFAGALLALGYITAVAFTKSAVPL